MALMSFGKVGVLLGGQHRKRRLERDRDRGVDVDADHGLAAQAE